VDLCVEVEESKQMWPAELIEESPTFEETHGTEYVRYCAVLP